MTAMHLCGRSRIGFVALLLLLPLALQAQPGAKKILDRTAEAFRRTDGEGVTFSFSVSGGRYRIRLGKKVFVERSGEVSYCLNFGEGERYPAVIGTAYGEIPAEVEAERVCVRKRGDSYFLKTDYVLFFSGFSQRHKILFTAKAAD